MRGLAYAPTQDPLSIYGSLLLICCTTYWARVLYASSRILHILHYYSGTAMDPSLRWEGCRPHQGKTVTASDTAAVTVPIADAGVGYWP